MRSPSNNNNDNNNNNNCNYNNNNIFLKLLINKNIKQTNVNLSTARQFTNGLPE